MPTLIACPGCTHKLTLPDDFAGQRVQCPACALQFAAMATAIPPMEVEPSAPPVDSSPEPVKKDNEPPLQTAFTPTGSTIDRATANASIYCIRCGTKAPDTADACPGCGYPIRELRDEEPRERRRPAWRKMQPIRGFLPIVGAMLIPVGVAVYIAGLIISEGFRRPGSPPFVLGILCSLLSILVELMAVACFMTWLYQAWRAVLRGDEDYSPGLMVGLLFVPFFNFYWMYRAIPGLSAATYQELKYVAPRREHASGWGPGIAACVLALIPPFWPIAICMFVAWSLIVGNAVNRLIRFHEELRDKSEGVAAESEPH